jgi:hypothetical protein
MPKIRRPELIVLDLSGAAIPPALWAAAVPLIGLAGDWDLRWHGYRYLLRQCDLALTDGQGAETLAREGFRHVRAADLFPRQGLHAEGTPVDAPRDLDLVAVARPPIHQGQGLWMTRLARLGERWRVSLHTDPCAALRRDLFRRARAVVPFGVQAFRDSLAHDAAAAGALFFQEDTHGGAQPALGRALLSEGRPEQAALHLRRAVAGDPLDAEAARALSEALAVVGDAAGQRRLAYDRYLLARAAPQLVPEEPWYAEQAARGEEITSIIVPCCNQVQYTWLCLESVLRHTQPPYALVLVDNGSTDETAAYLDEVRRRPGPVGVQVLRNEANRGFVVACNQALAVARGRYLVLLNNDTVLTAEWLDGLLDCARRHGPRVGMVGVVTNRAAPPHPVATDYTDLTGLAPFAARRRQQYRGRRRR